MFSGYVWCTRHLVGRPGGVFGAVHRAVQERRVGGGEPVRGVRQDVRRVRVGWGVRQGPAAARGGDGGGYRAQSETRRLS